MFIEKVKLQQFPHEFCPLFFLAENFSTFYILRGHIEVNILIVVII